MSCDELHPSCVTPKESYECAESTNSSNIAEVLKELREFRNDFTTLRTDLQKITTEIQAINEKFNDMETRFSSLEDRLIIVENKTSLIPKLKSELDSVREAMTKLENENHKFDQFSRMNNVEISGIPYTAGENLVSLLHSICNKVALPLDERDVDSIMRVKRFEVEDRSNSSESGRPRPPAIVVKFTRRICKDKLLAAVQQQRARRGLMTSDIGLSGPALNIFVSDHLAPRNKQLLKRARKIKAELNFSYLWIRDCKILMRKNEKSKVIVINKETDLSFLK
ncbi:uncharacterized protein LOC113238562 [Hyposmocoma kahamanoa]|uniref:uncharacterized protein LOC113238562 n=1 Tax=Hyposmocoma kahamanoa TaxID=1477025 RepID=UPI000E6DA2D5|nr:uncharacterized protein LOC113238562 [Hyposmocoma kahamanoa]